jgi:prepilin-type N-terminal cleavage/methylation domain-containing protein
VSRLNRTGLSLTELLVALVLLGLVTTGLYLVLTGNQRVYRAQTLRMDLQQNIRAAASILPAELRELDATDGDLLAIATSSVTFRAMRQLGFLCRTPVLGAVAAVLTVREQPLFGVRGFNTATDSILVYYEGDPRTRDDDGWVPGRLADVGGGTCDDGSPARLLTTALGFGSVTAPDGRSLPQLNQAGRITAGAPLRGFETITYRLYQGGDGQWHIGMSTGGPGGTQPLIGPVLPNGFELVYRDSAGAVTAAPARVATIEVRLRAPTAEPVRRPDGTLAPAVDSLVTVVALRNNRRF